LENPATKFLIKIWKKILPVGLLTIFAVPIAFSWQVWFNVIKCKVVTENDEAFYIILQNIPEFNYGVCFKNVFFTVIF
jgi:hypothetical protein